MNKASSKDVQKVVLTIQEFCDSHALGRTTFYELMKEGRGPRIMRVGRRTLITVEAAAEWRRRIEAETDQTYLHDDES